MMKKVPAQTVPKEGLHHDAHRNTPEIGCKDSTARKEKDWRVPASLIALKVGQSRIVAEGHHVLFT